MIKNKIPRVYKLKMYNDLSKSTGLDVSFENRGSMFKNGLVEHFIHSKLKNDTSNVKLFGCRIYHGSRLLSFRNDTMTDLKHDTLPNRNYMLFLLNSLFFLRQYRNILARR